MGTTKFFTLKEAKLNNNCPECYSTEGLQITFKQKFIENAFYKAITSNMVYDIYCNKCYTSIFPIQWTDDIERVIEYQKRAIKPKSKSLKLKALSWILIVLNLLIISLVILVITDVVSL